jgi:GntR family transcriptional regulator
MAFQLDRSNRLSYAAQVQRQALAQLVAGRLHPGDRLPSVRQLARDLGISRTTAERIQDVLCETTFAEVRPRSGAFVASPEGVTSSTRQPGVQVVYDFLKKTIRQARQLGLDINRLAHLIGAFDEHSRADRGLAPVCFPVIATRDAFECMAACFDASFPAQLYHLQPAAIASQFPANARYLLSGYYLRGRARTMADAVKCPLLYVRYNVELLDRSMAIRPGEFRYFVTRDMDNAETTRGFLASAYPEVPTTQYVVMPSEEFLKLSAKDKLKGTVWPTITAAPFLQGVVPASRTHMLHPLLADDFIEELRCLSLLG